MGGAISVDSRLGGGTTFTVLLPAANAASEPLRKRA
jgi:signal transduction histidine kinase